MNEQALILSLIFVMGAITGMLIGYLSAGGKL